MGSRHNLWPQRLVCLYGAVLSKMSSLVTKVKFPSLPHPDRFLHLIFACFEREYISLMSNFVYRAQIECGRFNQGNMGLLELLLDRGRD